MRVTQRDIAKRLNLSHATVSFVLSERTDVNIPDVTRQRVFEAARELGYRPNRLARALVRGKTDTIGLWLPDAPASSTLDAVRELRHELTQNGFEAVVRLAPPYSIEGELHEIDDWPTDAIVAMDCVDSTRLNFSNVQLPVITAGAVIDGRFDSVLVDFTDAYSKALRAAAEQGVIRALYLASMGIESLRDPKRDAFRRAAAEVGIEVEVAFSSDATPSGARFMIRERVRQGKRPEAVFCPTDQMAQGVVRGLFESDIQVPTDCLVFGGDGSAEGYLAIPSLSTMEVSNAEYARAVWTMLSKRLTHVESDPSVLSIQAKFVARESSTRAV